MKEETSGTGEKSGGGCLFCRIIAGEIPCKKVHEDANTFSFLDINPRNPGHTLVVPKRHCGTIFDMSEKEVGKLFESARLVAEGVRKGVKADGLSVVQSNGNAAGQVVSHMHVHLIPRFNTEGPISLEGVLSVKKMPEQNLDQMASSISRSIGASQRKDEIKFDF